MPWIKEKKKPDGYWDVKEHVMEEGKKYRNRTEFSKGVFTAWRKAKDYGWIDEIEWLKNKYNNENEISKFTKERRMENI